MVGWLLDTNVVSELRRPKPDPNVRRFLEAEPLDRLHLSVVTLADVRYGLERTSANRLALQDWLSHHLRSSFAWRILPVSEDVMLRWRHLVEAGRRRGHTFAQPDLIIAATASQHGLTVVTAT